MRDVAPELGVGAVRLGVEVFEVREHVDLHVRGDLLEDGGGWRQLEADAARALCGGVVGELGWPVALGGAGSGVGGGGGDGSGAHWGDLEQRGLVEELGLRRLRGIGMRRGGERRC